MAERSQQVCCTGCSYTFQVDASVAGKRIKCPQCGGQLSVPKLSVQPTSGAPRTPPPLPKLRPQPVPPAVPPKAAPSVANASENRKLSRAEISGIGILAVALVTAGVLLWDRGGERPNLVEQQTQPNSSVSSPDQEQSQQPTQNVDSEKSENVADTNTVQQAVTPNLDAQPNVVDATPPKSQKLTTADVEPAADTSVAAQNPPATSQPAPTNPPAKTPPAKTAIAQTKPAATKQAATKPAVTKPAATKPANPVPVNNTPTQTPPAAGGDQPAVVLNKTAPTDEQFSQLMAQLKLVKSAKGGLDLIDGFLKRHTLTESQQQAFTGKHKQFQERAQTNLHRNGSRWVTQAQAQEYVQKADQLVKQASQLLQARDYKGARSALRRASTIDHNGITAPFILGFLNSSVYLAGYFPQDAEKNFKSVLIRQPDHVSAINNLALTYVKLGEPSKAYSLWRRAVEISPSTPEVSHNIGRFVAEAQSKRLRVVESQVVRFSKLYQELIASGKGAAVNPTKGWLYMPLFLPKQSQEQAPTPTAAAGGALVNTACGSGFVVGPGVILTNRHVVKDADVVRIISPVDRKTEMKATVLAVSDTLDVALIQCAELKTAPVKIAPEMPRRSSDIMVLGFPQSDLLGQSLKATRGAIVALPDAAHNNMLLYDAVTNSGNSGGPVCDKRGAVIAVHAAGYRFAGKYGAGIPLVHVAPFLKQHQVATVPIEAAAMERPWPDVDQAVSRATVMINLYKSEVSLGLTVTNADKAEERSYLEDITCTTCNGGGQLACLVRKCARGVLSYPVRVTTGTDTFGRATYATRVVKKPCTVCRGKGRVACPNCVSGFDKRLLSR